jgi:hypothetical protein
MLKAQAKKRADAERRKRDGIFGSLKKGLDWAGSTVKDAASEAKEWAKDHKTEIAGFAVGLGCAIAFGPIGAVACSAIASGAVGVGAWQKSHFGSTDASEGWSYIKRAGSGASMGSLLGPGIRQGITSWRESRVAKQGAGKVDEFWDEFYKNYM